MISLRRPSRPLLAAVATVVVTATAPSAVGAQGVPEFEGQPCTIVGTEGDDVIYGTPERDVICGLGGNDTIWAGAGDDDIDGGAGDDRIGGGPGGDVVHAGDGADVVWGADGMDVLQGGLGPDRLWGGGGIDFIAADEFIEQGAVDSEPIPRFDRDLETNVLGGGDGTKDYLYGAAGDDRLYAGEGGGFDEWDGWDGSAGGLLFGFGGDDVLVGRPGPVPLAIYGGLGDDRIYANGGALGVLPERADNGDDVIYGSPYDDVLIDPYGDNRIVGGAGDDIITGGGPDSTGPSRVYGGDGDDRIEIDGVGSVAYGGNGNDRIEGGDRPDRIVGGDGDDALFGFGGDDVIIGGTGADLLNGSAGDDTIWTGNDTDIDQVNQQAGEEGTDRCIGGPGDIMDCTVVR